MREILDERMLEIHEKLLKMSTMVEDNIGESINALMNQDVNLADEVIHSDYIINGYEQEIENLCVKLVATQTPVGSDLRKIFSVLKIVTDLERIGDHCVNISKVVCSLGKYKLVKPLVDLPQMAKVVKKMVINSINAFVDGDEVKAKEIARIDDSVDDSYAKLYKELLNFLKEDFNEEEQIVGLLLVGRYLERIADHATNICERVIYMETGESVRY